jgi:DNA-binding XRE family transcriptional regulator
MIDNAEESFLITDSWRKVRQTSTPERAGSTRQAELAIHLGVSKQAVQQMEVGRRPYGEKAIKWLEKQDENV